MVIFGGFVTILSEPDYSMDFAIRDKIFFLIFFIIVLAAILKNAILKYVHVISRGS